jgi:hypothetical protein
MLAGLRSRVQLRELLNKKLSVVMSVPDVSG